MSEEDVAIDIPVTRVEALELEKEGFRMASPLPPSKISEDLRTELIRVLQVGDEKRNGAFTVSVAAHIEGLIHASKQILISEKIAANDMHALLQRRRHGGGYGMMTNPNYDGMLDGGDVGDVEGIGFPLLGSNGAGAENFGVKAIQELISAAKSMHDSPAKTIEALAVARKEGLHDVAAALEAKLGISTSTSTKPAETTPKEGTT